MRSWVEDCSLHVKHSHQANIWSSAGSTDLGSCGTFERWEIWSLGLGFKSYKANPFPDPILGALCVKQWGVPGMYSPCHEVS